MKLYDGGRVPNARRVRIFLAEKGVSIPLVPIDLGQMEHKSAAFLALNPFQRIPVLELDDGTILTESVAICRYIEELHPAPPLFGTDALSKARIEMWQRRVELDLYYPIQHAFRHLHPAMTDYEVPQIPAWGEINKPRAVAMMAHLDGELAGRPFIAGNQVSIADIIGFVAIEFLKPARIEMPVDLPHLRRWHAAFAARPSASA